MNVIEFIIVLEKEVKIHNAFQEIKKRIILFR